MVIQSGYSVTVFTGMIAFRCVIPSALGVMKTKANIVDDQVIWSIYETLFATCSGEVCDTATTKEGSSICARLD